MKTMAITTALEGYGKRDTQAIAEGFTVASKPACARRDFADQSARPSGEHTPASRPWCRGFTHPGRSHHRGITHRDRASMSGFHPPGPENGPQRPDRRAFWACRGGGAAAFRPRSRAERRLGLSPTGRSQRMARVSRTSAGGTPTTPSGERTSIHGGTPTQAPGQVRKTRCRRAPPPARSRRDSCILASPRPAR